MSNEILIKNGDKANWGMDNAPIDPERLPEGYPRKEVVTIEWDGNTQGLDAVDTAGGIFYRVSDVVLSNEQIKMGFIKDSEDLELPIAPMWDELVGAGKITDDISLIQIVAFVRKDNVSFGGVVFGTAGIYFANENDHYATKFTNETIYPIATEFLPTATTTAAGTVKQAAAVANVTAAPTAEEFNALLKSLRDAGILAKE